MKPGYQTSEFWLKVLAAALIGGLSALHAGAPDAGFPLLVSGAERIVVPLVLAWLAAKYGDNRTALKVQSIQSAQLASAQVAAQAAAKAVSGPAQAVATLNLAPSP